MATLPDTSTAVNTVQFDQALRTAAATARTRYAGEASRIHRGLVIALDGGVTLNTDGVAFVSSQQGDEVFSIVRDGQCDCPDFPRAPGGRCTHRWAACLVRKARTLAQRYEAARYFATYTAPDGTAHDGIATQTGQGWLFVAEDGLDPLFAATAALMLCGQVDLADGQLADDTRVQGSRVLTLLAR